MKIKLYILILVNCFLPWPLRTVCITNLCTWMLSSGKSPFVMWTRFTWINIGSPHKTMKCRCIEMKLLTKSELLSGPPRIQKFKKFKFNSWTILFRYMLNYIIHKGTIDHPSIFYTRFIRQSGHGEAAAYPSGHNRSYEALFSLCDSHRGVCKKKKGTCSSFIWCRTWIWCRSASNRFLLKKHHLLSGNIQFIFPQVMMVSLARFTLWSQDGDNRMLNWRLQNTSCNTKAWCHSSSLHLLFTAFGLCAHTVSVHRSNHAW